MNRSERTALERHAERLRGRARRARVAAPLVGAVLPILLLTPALRGAATDLFLTVVLVSAALLGSAVGFLVGSRRAAYLEVRGERALVRAAWLESLAPAQGRRDHDVRSRPTRSANGHGAVPLTREALDQRQ